MTPTLPHRNVPAVTPPLAPEPVLMPADPESTDVSILTIAIVLLRHRWVWICSAILFAVVFGFANYTPIQTYSSTATFTPRQRPQASAGSAILSQLGLGGGSSNSAYYLELIKSREILGPVVESTYTVRTPTGIVTGRLIDIYHVQHPNPRQARASAISILNFNAKASSQPTGMMKLSVTSPYPELSAAVATRILDELNRFNLNTRRVQASGERLFIEMQLSEAADRLREAEQELQAFTSQNRMLSAYSEGMLVYERLKRRVGMRQDLYTSLAKQLDEARIEEVRDSPVLTIIEPPEVPLGPNAPIWPTKAILGAIIGLMVGIFISFVHAYFVRHRDEETNEYEELAELKKRTADDLKHFWRPIGRILSTGRA
jgi:uncharacterized protein involved in exopolysaccharide biosynthesis